MTYIITALYLCVISTNTEVFTTDKIPDKIGSWTKEQKVLEFSPDNLFDYIDGDADRYLPYNFQKLNVLFYRNDSNPEKSIEVQIYQMATHLEAFGIYSVHRDRNKNVFPYGEDGFIGENQAMFYQTRYFVKLITQHTQNAKSDLELFGKEISGLLPRSEDTIPELSCMDQSNKIPRSECYLAKDVLAQSFLPRGTTTLFKIGDKTATGFIVMFKDDTETKKGWNEYKNYLEEIGAEYQSQENELIITSPASEIAVISLLKNRIIGVWMPQGDISELQKIQQGIKTCLTQTTKRTDTSQDKKESSK
ncbi:MAG: hypothetical protein LDL53_07410 [Candidatus Hydrogenedens sp.]|nr:hypothetical protein [Candidatus Hydrogenedens sp.]